jgi:hypothetical protein
MTKHIALIVLVGAVGCTFIARDTETYRKDTRALIEERNGDIKSCYDTALAANPTQSGDVVVNFTVEKKTGNFTNVAVDPNATTAPEALSNCVLRALEGLKLTPEDQREGQATFTWRFSAAGGAPVEAAPAPAPEGEGKPVEGAG